MVMPRWWVVVVGTALALAGCAGDDAGSQGDRPQPTTSPPQDTSSDAFTADDAGIADSSEGDAGSPSGVATPGKSSGHDRSPEGGEGSDAVDVQAAVEVRDGQVQGGVEDVRADVGDVVELTVTSDVADTVHVHGYDLVAEVEPQRPALVTFQGDIPGVFEVELEQRGLTVAELVVGG